MKKVYSLWIMLKVPKRKDGHMNAYETNERIICGATVEERSLWQGSYSCGIPKQRTWFK